ncbi:MAG: type II toxin-antitoxin system HicA family toxin [Pseudomonadota bacterium]
MVSKKKTDLPVKNASDNTEIKNLEEIYSLAADCASALEQQGNLSFDDLCRLAEKAGFVFSRQGGSHQMYKHPIYSLGHPKYDAMNFQDQNGQAKAYQVRQLVEFIRFAQPKTKEGKHGNK